MTIHDYLRILRKGWLFVVIGLLLGIAGGAARTILATPEYTSTTKVFVSVQVSGSTTVNELNSGNTFAQQKIKSYVDVATSPTVLDPVIRELGLQTTASQLASGISASSTTGTVILEITATDPSPETAAKIANATADSLRTVVVDQLERPTGGGPSLVKMQTVQPAVPAERPSTPNLPLNLAIGALIGLIVGIAAAVLRSALDTKVHSRSEVEALTDAAILGGIGFDPESVKHPLIVNSDPRSPRAESFRSLRTNLRFVNLGDKSRSFVITSSVPGEGKSTTAANLALALAEAGSRVVLVDGDLRLPKLADYLGLEGGVGLTDVLIGRVSLTDVLQRWGNRELFVLPAGQVPPNPSELLGSEAMASLVHSLQAGADVVIIDAPPLLPVTDAAVIATHTSGAIVIAASGKVKKNELAASLRALQQAHSHIVGVVLTMLPLKGPDAYGGGHYYYGGSSQTKEPVVAGGRRRR